MCHDCTGSHHGIVTDGDTLQNSGIGTDPDIFAQDDRSGISQLAFLRLNEVVQCGKHDIIAL